MSPSEIILRKNLVASGLSSAEWSSLSAALRDRAFFSSRVQSLRFLETCRARIADLLAANPNSDGATTSRAQAVSDIMRAAREAGIATGKGGLTDPGSPSRAAVIVDTNAAMAAGYARAEQANSYGARLAFPAYELVRVEERREPRDWRRRWIAAGGKLYQGRMVALKDDPVWTAISRFGHPYPPFDFGSGMGLDDVSFDDALALGLVKDDYQPPEKSPLKTFNDGLEADLNVDDGNTLGELRKIFGDQIRNDNGKLSWRHDLIREAFNSEKPFAIRLGEPSPSLLSKLPDSLPAQSCEGKPLTVTQDWLNHKRKDGGTHRDHFYPLETDERNIPLTVEDLELIPSIWNDPDAVSDKTSNKNRILLERKALDGGIYNMVVDIENQPRLVTFYKKKSADPR